MRRSVTLPASRVGLAALAAGALVLAASLPAQTMSIEDYLRLTGGQMSVAEALAQPGADFDFDPPRIGIGIKPADFG